MTIFLLLAVMFPVDCASSRRMETPSSLPPQTASPAPLSLDCGRGLAKRLTKSVIPTTLVATVEDKIADSCAESSLSSSALSPPAPQDFKEPAPKGPPRRGSLPTQDPEQPSLETTAPTRLHGGTKRLHAALAPVDADDASDEDLVKRRKLVLTLQDAESDGLTNWYSSLIVYNEKIEHPAALREILDEAAERGISHLSPAEIESITTVQDDELPPRPGANRCSLQDHATSSRMLSALLKPAAGPTRPVPTGPSKPSGALASDPNPSSDTDSPIPARSPSRHFSGWTPVNQGGEEAGEDDGNKHHGSPDAAQRADNPVRTNNDGGGGDYQDAAVALPEVGDCFRGRTYGGGRYPGTTWAALVEPLMVENFLANMKAGRKVVARRRGHEHEAAAPKGKTTL